MGYSNRISYSDFVKRYSILANPFKSGHLPASKEACAEILQKLGLKNWKIGKTKIFLKYYHAEQLTRMYDEINSKIILIQSAVRSWLARKTYVKYRAAMIKAAIVVQRCIHFLSFFLNIKSLLNIEN